jgi:hypothetical protein
VLEQRNEDAHPLGGEDTVHRTVVDRQRQPHARRRAHLPVDDDGFLTSRADGQD